MAVEVYSEVWFVKLPSVSWSISGQLPVVSGQRYPVEFLTTGSTMEQCGLFSFCQVDGWYSFSPFSC